MLVKDFLTKDRWCQGYYALKADGTACNPHDPAAERFCLDGALNRLYPDPGQWLTARQKLNTVIGPATIRFNDENNWETVHEALVKANI